MSSLSAISLLNGGEFPDWASPTSDSATDATAFIHSIVTAPSIDVERRLFFSVDIYALMREAKGHGDDVRASRISKLVGNGPSEWNKGTALISRLCHDIRQVSAKVSYLSTCQSVTSTDFRVDHIYIYGS